MKLFFTFLFSFFISCWCFAQSGQTQKTAEQKPDIYFENSEKQIDVGSSKAEDKINPDIPVRHEVIDVRDQQLYFEQEKKKEEEKNKKKEAIVKPK
ncbi:MAG: hypothetical protein HY841_11570 [Bacteroidetes bacterium]|nr:hypothetical protein [Bacteroidota bacterium]